MITLGENRYGKSCVRVVKVERGAERHTVSEWSVDVWLEGKFQSCFEEGDNSRILPTDTMKNTVYALARGSRAANAEQFAIELVTYLLENNLQADEAAVTIAATPWTHIHAAGREHTTAFVQSEQVIETAAVTYPRVGGFNVSSGFRHLPLLKTAQSGFAGFIRDKLTTLRETNDRLLGTLASGEWRYSQDHADYSVGRRNIMDALLNTFALHDSLSVQQTLYAMGKSALEAEPAISEIRLSMPNKHCNLVDLSPFGLDNPNHIFVPTDEPHGSIEACVRRIG